MRDTLHLLLLLVLTVFASQAWSVMAVPVTTFQYNAGIKDTIAENTEPGYKNYIYDNIGNLQHYGVEAITCSQDEKTQIGSFFAFIDGFIATKGTPKPRTNKLGPNPKAEGPHTQFKTDPKKGKVTGYTEFDAAGNPVKRFRGQGKPHGGTEPPFILEPKPGKGPGAPPKVPRQRRPDELPRGY